MTNQTAAARAAILNAIGAFDAVEALLLSVRDDIERRLAMPNRVTRRADVTVQTEGGVSQPYVTVQVEPDSGFATLISLDMVSPGDVSLGEDALRRARAQLESALAALSSSAPSTTSTAEETRRRATQANTDGLMTHLGIDPKKGPVQ